MRSRLPKEEARNRYVELGEQAVLEQVRDDAEKLDDRLRAVGPFARLDANAVAARDGKTRGAISNSFGSQAAFQAETMALALRAGDWIERIEYPAPADFPNADAWLDALFAGESERGPQHGGGVEVNYAALWVLWLSVLPYSVWSESLAAPSLEELQQWLGRLAAVFQDALDHFDLKLRDGTTIDDLVSACGCFIEGVWLSQCLTGRHPLDPSESMATVLRRGGRMLWLGATEPRR